MPSPAYGLAHILADLPSQSYRFWTGEGAGGVMINAINVAGTWTKGSQETISWNGPNIEIINNTGAAKTAKFAGIGWHPTTLTDSQVLMFMIPHAEVPLPNGASIIYTGFTITFTTADLPVI